MKKYIVYMIETTPARASIDGKDHTHKYYFYPMPDNLKKEGFSAYWSYKNGKRGALRFNSKAEAERVARHHNAKVEEV